MHIHQNRFYGNLVNNDSQMSMDLDRYFNYITTLTYILLYTFLILTLRRNNYVDCGTLCNMKWV